MADSVGIWMLTTETVSVLVALNFRVPIAAGILLPVVMGHRDDDCICNRLQFTTTLSDDICTNILIFR